MIKKNIYWFCLFAGVFLLFLSVRYVYKSSYESNVDVVEDFEDVPLSFSDSVLNFIFELRLEHPYIVYSQALVESSHFRSSVFLENNNMFGMKMPERRPTLAKGIRRGHSFFSNWQECVYDYALFQTAYMRGLSEDEYIAKLGRSYAKNKEYEKIIRLVKGNVKRKI